MVNPLGLAKGNERSRAPQQIHAGVVSFLSSPFLVFRPPRKDSPICGRCEGKRKKSTRSCVFGCLSDPSLPPLHFSAWMENSDTQATVLLLKLEQLLSADPTRKQLLEGFAHVCKRCCRENRF